MKFGRLGYYPEFDHKDMEYIDFSSDKTKVLHGEFGNYLKGLREKRVNEFITHKR